MFLYKKQQMQNFVSGTYIAAATLCVCVPDP